MTKCPHCGGQLEIVATGRQAKRRRRASRSRGRIFNAPTWTGDGADSLHLATPPGTSHVLSRPAREPNTESDVTVPLLQAAITGTLAGVAVTGAWLALGWPRPGLATFASLIGVTLLDWRTSRQELRELLWRVEELTIDLDGDGRQGEPNDAGDDWWRVNGEKKRRVRDKESEKKHLAFVRFVRSVYGRQQAGRPTGQKAMRGIVLTPDYKVNDDLHREFVQVLVENDLANESGNGWTLLVDPDTVEQVIRAD